MSTIGVDRSGASRSRSWGAAGGWLAALVAFTVAVSAAVLTGSRVGVITGGVESLSTASTAGLRDLTTTLRLSYAFGVGMVAAVNPCGFALLPAYLGLYLGGTSAGTRTSAGFARAGWVSLMVTLGFVLLFGAAGLLLSVTTSALGTYLSVVFPLIGLLVGVLLVLTGGRMLGGGGVRFGLGERLAARLGQGARGGGSRGYLLYGMAYAAASLGCTLPLFLAVVVSTLTAEGMLAGMVQFLLYALGMGFVITVLTLSTTFVNYAAVSRARSLGRYVQPVGALLLLLAGAYVIYYWLTVGGVLGMLA